MADSGLVILTSKENKDYDSERKEEDSQRPTPVIIISAGPQQLNPGRTTNRPAL